MQSLEKKVLNEQFQYLKENYELKRKQIHDASNQNILLSGYLNEGKIDEALNYLKEMQAELKQSSIARVSGISIVDIILDYKRERAKEKAIELLMDIQIYF